MEVQQNWKKLLFICQGQEDFPPSFGETGLSVDVAADKPVFLTPESLENHSAQATFNVFICDCL